MRNWLMESGANRCTSSLGTTKSPRDYLPLRDELITKRVGQQKRDFPISHPLSAPCSGLRSVGQQRHGFPESRSKNPRRLSSWFSKSQTLDRAAGMRHRTIRWRRFSSPGIGHWLMLFDHMAVQRGGCEGYCPCVPWHPLGGKRIRPQKDDCFANPRALSVENAQDGGS